MDHQFNVVVNYYDRSGRFVKYAFFRASARITGTVNRGRHDEEHTPNIHDVVATLRGLRDTGGPGRLPGMGSTEDGWDGYIIVTHEHCPRPGFLMPPERS